MSDPVRLSKRLIELTGCSRREAELYIQGGWVTVDGHVVDTPELKVLKQQVLLLPGATATPLEPVTLLLHLPSTLAEAKAPELLQMDSHWPADPSTTRPLKGHFTRLTTSLPLQADATGLLVFTQDWRILRKLTDDAAKLEQEYIAEVSGTLAEGDLERLNRGYKALPPIKVSWQNETRLRFAIKNPAPGLLAEVCASVGLRIVTLKRIRIGATSMGKLPLGQWRYLGAGERF